MGPAFFRSEKKYYDDIISSMDDFLLKCDEKKIVSKWFFI